MNGAVIKLVSRLVRPYSFSRNFLCTSVGPDVSPLVSAVASPPIVIDHKYKDLRVTTEPPREAWVEGLSTTKEEKVGIVSLHPDIFAALPRLDIIHENVVWQLKYKKVNYRHAKLPVEMRGPGKGFGRKPWPQKGTGRARQGSTRAPQWVKGGTVHGPRRYTTNFYMLPLHKRVLGLISTLSGKFAQNDLKIVSSLETPSDEAAFLEDLARERTWGNSVLFVDENDEMPRNITLSTDQIPHFNLLPVYGLNVHSMLKHDTLVLTLSALEKIQERLLYQLNRPDYMQKNLQKYVH